MYRYLSLSTTSPKDEDISFEDDTQEVKTLKENPTIQFDGPAEEGSLQVSLKPQEEVKPNSRDGNLTNTSEHEQKQESSTKARLTAPNMAPPPARSSSPPRLKTSTSQHDACSSAPQWLDTASTAICGGISSRSCHQGPLEHVNGTNLLNDAPEWQTITKSHSTAWPFATRLGSVDKESKQQFTRARPSTPFNSRHTLSAEVLQWTERPGCVVCVQGQSVQYHAISVFSSRR